MTEFVDPRFELPAESTTSGRFRGRPPGSGKPRPKMDFSLERRLWAGGQMLIGLLILVVAAYVGRQVIHIYNMPDIVGELMFVVLFLSAGLFFTHAVLIAVGQSPLAFARVLVGWSAVFIVLALITWTVGVRRLLLSQENAAGTMLVFGYNLIPLALIAVGGWGLWRAERSLEEDIENWIDAELPARIYDDTIPPRPREETDDEPLA